MGAFYLISGNEDYAVKTRAAERIFELCGNPPESHPSLEVIRGDRDNEDAVQVLDKLLLSLDTPSFLSEDKVVWLKHFTKFDEAFSETNTKKKPSRIERLSVFLQGGIPSDLTLLIDGPGLDRRKAFYKTCVSACKNSGGELEWLEKLDPKARGFARQMILYIHEVVAKRGKRIEDSAAAFLAETIGADEARRVTEIEKLLTYIDTQPVITLADCRMVCSRTAETLPWDFSSALAERNTQKALSLIPEIVEHMEQEKKQGASRPEIALVYAVMKEFRDMSSVKCEGEQFGIPQKASSDYFYRMAEEFKRVENGNGKSVLASMHPFRAYKAWENACRFSDRELVLAFRAIVAANRSMVLSGSGTGTRLVLELLTIRIADGMYAAT